MDLAIVYSCRRTALLHQTNFAHNRHKTRCHVTSTLLRQMKHSATPKRRSLVEGHVKTGEDTPSRFIRGQMEHREGLFQIIRK
jgi:hypothetical protein